MNKFEIKTNIISAINNLQSPTLTEDNVREIMEPLYSEKGSQFVMTFLINELFTTVDNLRMDVVLFLINELVTNEQLEKYVFELLSSELDDEKKYKLINLLRSHGKVLNYEMFSQYLLDPERFINEDTRAFLNTAHINPELKIDFIDFLNAIEYNDKIALLESLFDDYGRFRPEDLLIPLLYSTTDQAFLSVVLELIAKTKSKKVLNELNRILPVYENNKEVKQKIKKCINMLKLSSRGDKIFVAQNFDSYFYKTFISIPDGLDNYGIIVSRIRPDGSVQMFSTAVNLKKGVIDCFGFNEILSTDFAQIVNRFYKEDQKVEVLPNLAKMLLDKAEYDSLKRTAYLPYEFVCWKNILEDVVSSDESFVFRESNYFKIQLNKNFINNLFSIAPYIRTWFYDDSNETFAKIISKICEKYKKSKEADEATVEDFVDLALKVFLSEGEISIFGWRLMLAAYLYKASGISIAANILFNIYLNSNYKEMFLKYIFKKSLYFYFKKYREKEKFESISSNVLVLNPHKSEEKFDIQFLNSVISILTRDLSKYE